MRLAGHTPANSAQGFGDTDAPIWVGCRSRCRCGSAWTLCVPLIVSFGTGPTVAVKLTDDARLVTAALHDGTIGTGARYLSGASMNS